jgi:arylsulfatase A
MKSITPPRFTAMLSWLALFIETRRVMNRSLFVLALLASSFGQALAADATKPNILLILADDLGYGDVRCYNDQSKVATPHLDRLAREGMRFTDAHSPATVCTPTRYSLMTGQMAFRMAARCSKALVDLP